MIGLTAYVGTNELVMVFAGGTVSPATPVGLVVAVAGTVFASFCAIGALAAPAAIRVWREYINGEEVVSAQ